MNWQDPNFDCLKKLPFLRRVVVEMYCLEGELENGGLSQLLWNTFYHWRTLLFECSQGYQVMGFSEQAAAIGDFVRLFEGFEGECGRLIEIATRTGRFELFGEWCVKHSDALISSNESCFFSDRRIDEKREQWLREHSLEVFADN